MPWQRQEAILLPDNRPSKPLQQDRWRDCPARPRRGVRWQAERDTASARAASGILGRPGRSKAPSPLRSAGALQETTLSLALAIERMCVIALCRENCQGVFMKLTAIIYADSETGWLVAECPEIGTASQGHTEEEALANLQKAP